MAGKEFPGPEETFTFATLLNVGYPLFLLRIEKRLPAAIGLSWLLCCSLALCTIVPLNAAGNVTGIWANEGGDKVTQDELRVTRGTQNLTGSVINKAWNGQKISLFGAANESVSFDLVLEAGGANSAANVSVQFDTLTSATGATIKTTTQPTGNGIFNWVGRPIELFLVRYLQIKGVSQVGWTRFDERQIPKRFERPMSSTGVGYGGWTDRPDHDKMYPDILVPLELSPTFQIASGQNQSIWADIYIPKTTPAGSYSGEVTVKENGTITHTIPVTVKVQPFALPDTPTVKEFSNLDPTELMWRYVTGYGGYIGWGTQQGARIRHISDVYFQFFHRHRIDLISGETEIPPTVGIHPFFQPRYTGSLYQPANGYDGPGVGVGNTLYAVGPYGTWGRNIFNEQSMWSFADPIGAWFKANMPNLPYFIYLQDEPEWSDLVKVENWSKWLGEDPGPGHNMKSMSTVSMASANEQMPDLQIVTDGSSIGECPSASPWSCDNVAYTFAQAEQIRAKPNRENWHYGSGHPGVGTTNTEDDGIAMRTFAWVQVKLNIDRWFSWYANLNTQGIDWFQQTATWGCFDMFQDWSWGQQSDHNYTNGYGLLVYPGSDITDTQNSYGVDGPFASLRLKEWRRGIEDGDYLTLAKAIDPVGTAAIIQKVMPAALWENKAPHWPSGDPSYYLGGISWSSDPDDWESARAQLAQIIATHCQNPGAMAEASSPCTAVVSGNDQLPLTSPTIPSVIQPDSVNQSAPTALHFVPMAPCRVVDTRVADGNFGLPSLSGSQSRTFPLTAGKCSLPATARAFSMNITAVPHGSLSYLTVWPTGEQRPSASNLNAYDGRVKANAAIIPAGTGGSVDVFAAGDTDLIMDVNGYFVDAAGDTVGLAFFPLKPCRVVDTRLNWGLLGGPFVFGKSARHFPVQQSSCGIPGSAQAYSFNYTAIPHNGLAWMSAWPSGQPMPDSSILNATTNAVTANAGITPAGADGAITIYANDDTDLIIDVNGYFAPAAPGGLSLHIVPPCRAFDSRLAADASPIQGRVAFDLSSNKCGIPSSANMIVLNSTVVPSTKLDYLVLWATGEPQPVVSTLNAYDGQVMSNLAIVPSTNGSISAFTTDRTHLILDVTGYFQ